ncbi:hypothetical protein [Methylocystis echinoides]|jgi:lysylphosphatidylglycerol synthetase-like protein (DUF2156 family)|uniref:hypothetical protein n=1 Tax=Methylocystis echinoides TaxID=29468 RepID=UPI003444B2DF
MQTAYDAVLLFGVTAFVASGLLLGRSTYKVAKDQDWTAAAIGLLLTGVCALAAGLICLLLFYAPRARASAAPPRTPVLRIVAYQAR